MINRTFKFILCVILFISNIYSANTAILTTLKNGIILALALPVTGFGAWTCVNMYNKLKNFNHSINNIRKKPPMHRKNCNPTINGSRFIGNRQSNVNPALNKLQLLKQELCKARVTLGSWALSTALWGLLVGSYLGDS